jgi:ABC-type histidine transport system ATPase subunit
MALWIRLSSRPTFIVRALATEPVIMLFGELTSASDPELEGEGFSVIHNLANEGVTMVIVPMKWTLPYQFRVGSFL